MKYLFGLAIYGIMLFGGVPSFAESPEYIQEVSDIPWCGSVQELSKIDNKIIFYYRHSETCIGPAIKKYSHTVYSAKAFDLGDFMKTVPQGRAIFFGKGSTHFADDGTFLFNTATFLIVARDTKGAVHGWNVGMSGDGTGHITRTFFKDILNEKNVAMLSSDATFVLLAEIDYFIFRFHRIPENSFYAILLPYIQYLFGFAGKGV